MRHLQRGIEGFTVLEVVIVIVAIIIILTVLLSL